MVRAAGRRLSVGGLPGGGTGCTIHREALRHVCRTRFPIGKQRLLRNPVHRKMIKGVGGCLLEDNSSRKEISHRGTRQKFFYSSFLNKPSFPLESSAYAYEGSFPYRKAQLLLTKKAFLRKALRKGKQPCQSFGVDDLRKKRINWWRNIQLPSCSIKSWPRKISKAVWLT